MVIKKGQHGKSYMCDRKDNRNLEVQERRGNLDINAGDERETVLCFWDKVQVEFIDRNSGSNLHCNLKPKGERKQG